MDYSQNKEQETIVSLLTNPECPVTPNLLDIGAYDGRTFSNSLRLVELGWSGIMVEPSPNAFIALVNEHKDRPNIKLINAMIGTERSIVKFWNCADAVSTTEISERDLWAKAGVEFCEIYVPSITIEDIIFQFGSFEFVNIDTEGTSVDIFKQFPLNVGWPKVFCIEHNQRIVEITDHAKEYGYRMADLNGCNIILEGGHG